MLDPNHFTEMRSNGIKNQKLPFDIFKNQISSIASFTLNFEPVRFLKMLELMEPKLDCISKSDMFKGFPTMESDQIDVGIEDAIFKSNRWIL